MTNPSGIPDEDDNRLPEEDLVVMEDHETDRLGAFDDVEVSVDGPHDDADVERLAEGDGSTGAVSSVDDIDESSQPSEDPIMETSAVYAPSEAPQGRSTEPDVIVGGTSRRRSAISLTSGLRSGHDERALRRGELQEDVRLVKGTGFSALARQRTVRGVIFSTLVGLSVSLVILTGLLITATSGRTVRVGPAIEQLSKVAATGTTSEADFRYWGGFIVNLLDTWSWQNIETKGETVLPWLHPSAHKDVLEGYAEISSKAISNAQYRHSAPAYVHFLSVRDGLVYIAVLTKQLDMVGDPQTNKTREIVNDADLIWVLTATFGATTEENPQGLYLVNRKEFSMASWLDGGRPAFWDTTPEVRR